MHIARCQVKTRFEHEHGLQAAAEILDALEADPVAVRNTVIEFELMSPAGIVHVGDAGIQNAVQGDAALRMGEPSARIQRLRAIASPERLTAFLFFI